MEEGEDWDWEGAMDKYKDFLVDEKYMKMEMKLLEKEDREEMKEEDKQANLVKALKEDKDKELEYVYDKKKDKA